MFNRNSKRDNTLFYGLVDERTEAVVYKGDAYTGRFMIFAVLGDVVIRGLHLIEPLTRANWDLMLIVLVGGMISSVFQIKNKIVENRPINYVYIILFMLICAAIAFLAIELCLRILPPH